MELPPVVYHHLVRPKWFMDKYMKRIINGSFSLDGKRVLDFGCGVGSGSVMFSPSSYMGVDCDSRRVAYARRLYPGYRFCVLKGSILSLPDDSVDYILILSVLHHIPSEAMSGYLEEFRRILKPWGIVMAVEPCYYQGCSFINRYMALCDRGKYIRSEDEYLGIFDTCRYRTEVLKRFNQMLMYNKIFFTAAPMS